MFSGRSRWTIFTAAALPGRPVTTEIDGAHAAAPDQALEHVVAYALTDARL
jgi:hypothetical protein